MSPWFLEQIRLPPEPVQVFLVAPVAFVSEFLLQSRHIPTERSLGKTAQSRCSPALWGELLSVSQTPPGFGKRGRVSTGDVRLSLAPRELPDRGGTPSGNRPEELVWASSGCAPGCDHRAPRQLCGHHTRDVRAFVFRREGSEFQAAHAFARSWRIKAFPEEAAVWQSPFSLLLGSPVPLRAASSLPGEVLCVLPRYRRAPNFPGVEGKTDT